MTNKIFNRIENKHKRVTLRANQTAPEQIIWSKVRKKALGYKFRRQHGIGKYIVDFYCKELSLVIEIDGDSHFNDQSIIDDTKRDQYLSSLGLSVLRFTNKQVNENVSGVFEYILRWIEDNKDQPLPNLPLARGRDK